jgi:hypothetical protein
MRIRSFVIWFLVIAAALIVLVIWFGGRRTEPPLASPEQTNAEAVAETTVTQPKQPSQPARPPVRADVPPTVATNADAILPGSKAEQMREVLSSANHMPIVYYGKLEDQFGSPVAGAAVEFSIHVNTGYESTTERGRVASDAGGLFTISGYKGADLRVVPKKAGYAIASTNRFANYSHLFPEEERAHPDPSSPVVITMWKLQGAEPMVGLDHKYKLPYTAAPIYFDLLVGKVVPAGGDLKITVSRAPGLMSGASRLDWGVQIEAVDGGLIDSAGLEETTYGAPTEGYQPTITIAFSTNAWNGGFNRGFFVTSRGGQVYSKLGLAFTINQKPDDLMYVAFGGVASTNGSRNWEGDPNTLKP